MTDKAEKLYDIDWNRLSTIKGYSDYHSENGYNNFLRILAPSIKKWYQLKRRHPLYTKEELLVNCKMINDRYNLYPNSDELLDLVLSCSCYDWSFKFKQDKEGNRKYYRYYDDFDWMIPF